MSLDEHGPSTPDHKRCTYCGGLGREVGGGQTCPVCGGEGEVQRTVTIGRVDLNAVLRMAADTSGEPLSDNERSLLRELARKYRSRGVRP